MASNPVVNTLTFTGSVAGQASIQAQGIAGNLTFLLPNTAPIQGNLLSVTAVNGNNVFLGFAAAQSLSNIALSALSPTGASNGDVIQLVGGAWTFSAFVPGAGTVTSVAFTTPAELSIAGSPITTSGTLALSWASGTGSGGQGKVIATPSGGGAGAYAGRVLVAGDIPALPYDAAGAAATAQSNAEAFATSGDSATLATAEAYVQTKSPVTSNFLTGYNASTGVFSAGQPAFSDLSGSLTIAQINSKQGNGNAVQLTNTGATVTGNVVTYDANSNVVDSGTALSSLASNASVALKANIASPTFTGVPAAPTASALTNSTQIATTAYADAAVAVETSRAEAAEATLTSLQGNGSNGQPASLNNHIATGNNATFTGGTSGTTGITITLSGNAAYTAANTYSVMITPISAPVGVLWASTTDGAHFTVFSTAAAETAAFFWTCFGKTSLD